MRERLSRSGAKGETKEGSRELLLCICVQDIVALCWKEVNCEKEREREEIMGSEEFR